MRETSLSGSDYICCEFAFAYAALANLHERWRNDLHKKTVVEEARNLLRNARMGDSHHLKIQNFCKWPKKPQTAGRNLRSAFYNLLKLYSVGIIDEKVIKLKPRAARQAVNKAIETGKKAKPKKPIKHTKCRRATRRSKKSSQRRRKSELAPSLLHFKLFQDFVFFFHLS